MCDMLAQFASPALASLSSLAAPLEMLTRTWPYVVMLLGFSLIVFVHELGHFMVAKWVGVRVEKFAIGFGRELFGYSHGETRYSFNLLPLGGYVKMLGQEDFDDKTEELQFKDDPRSFINKPVGRRMAIVSAGVVMNVLFACLLFMIVFMIGMRAVGTRIGYVEPDSPANLAGLLPGDRIIRINGETMDEFRDVSMAIQLASPHEPVEFVVERGEKILPPVYLKPDYRRPENTRDPRRQVIGILPGVTRKIVWVGPAIDPARSDHPRVGDVIVEVDGIEVTDANANQMRELLVYAKEIYVERQNTDDTDAAPERIRVDVPPELAIFPSDTDNRDTINVLGLTPLMRFGAVHYQGRAYLAGLEVGDIILSWDDSPHPSRAAITRAIRDNAESDIAFRVQKSDGRITEGFVRPKHIRFGSGTIGAVCKTSDKENTSDSGPRAVFGEVRPSGRAHQVGLEAGDIILNFNGINNPTSREVRKLIRENIEEILPVTVQKPNGETLVTAVRPKASGSIDATYALVADEVLQVGKIIEEIDGRPSPAAEAGIPAGALLVSVDGRPVTNWRNLIETFRAAAGGTVRLAYVSVDGREGAAQFRVPHSLRTLLGVGSEARILSVDGRRTIRTKTSRGVEEVHVGYHVGLRRLLTELVGRTNVPVEYRPNPVAAVETVYLDVTTDMVDPWVGRIAFAPNVEVGAETTLLRRTSALGALRIGINKTYRFIAQVYLVLKRMIFSKTVGVENVSGPLGIVSIGGQIAQAGLVEFLYFLAIISANLAVINFLPLPIVDGGLMVFLFIEKIKGSPVSIRVQVATQMLGLFLIIGLFVFVTYNDVLRLWG